MPETAGVSQIDPIEAMKQQILSDVEKDLKAYLGNAQTAAWNTDGKMNCSFTTTVSISKKVVSEEARYSLKIESRERIPRPVIIRELEFNEGKQLVLI
jgi:hypothetical protein